MTAHRNAIFLEEMGVGPLWTLRAPAPAPALEVEVEVEVELEVEVEVEVELAPAAQLAEVAAAAPAVPQQRLAQPAMAVTVAAPVSAGIIAALTWTELSAAVASCTRCDLCHSRKNAVPGRGAQSVTKAVIESAGESATNLARWMVVGSAPTLADEEQGLPVSGAAGQLLDNMLQAIALAPQQVYVTNLVKCRPYRVDGMPTLQQSAACAPFLARELALLQATTVLALGAPAARGLAGSIDAALAADTPTGAGNMRGAVHGLGASSMVVTLPLDELLKDGKNKAQAWSDLCLARKAQAGRYAG